ncbi:MAG TPA: PLP-dependent aminotransferase family protein [Lachnospiraceae bacterium]|nr:PLP-dependent aminotransferase family protein [Lachnospiraceae bacterium]
MQELTMDLDPGSRIPLYEQIYEYIKSEIRSGAIPAREKLPSTRALSHYLEVSRSTVELAYEQLLSEGYIEAEPCRGFFVASIEGLYQIRQSRQVQEKPQQQENRTQYRYDFTPNGIDLKSFPYSIWRKLSREVLMDDRLELFRQGDSQGEYELRREICNYLHQARGVNCTPEQLIIGAGNEYLIMLLSTIIGQDHRIAFENPTYRQAYRVFENLSYQIDTVDMDQNGIEVKKLEQKNVNMAYVMPSHQYPLGTVMPLKRRLELLKWAEKEPDRYIIEDDYDSEFRYKGKPIPALQGYDINGKVIYIGTFSRSIAPAIRMSYLVLPMPLLKEYYRKSRFMNSTVPRTEQMIVKNFLAQGYYERHLNKMRALYKSRHDVLLETIRPLLKSGSCEISGENAGVHLLLTFRDGRTEEELIRLAALEDIKIYGLSQYFAEQEKAAGGPATVLLGYANLSEDSIREAAGRLVRRLRKEG